MGGLTSSPELARHAMRGTSAAEMLDASALVAFEWQAGPADSWSFWQEMSRYSGSAPSTATGLVVFEGMAAGSSFRARAAAVQFSFSDGYAFTAQASPSSWSWNASTGTMDPGSAGRFYLTDRTITLTSNAGRYDASDGYYIWGSEDQGRWTPRQAPLAVEIGAGEGDDTLLGSAAADRLLGDAGDDRLEGGGSNDRLSGGDGHDTLQGDDGADILAGQRGDDLICPTSGLMRRNGGVEERRIWGSS